MSATLTPDTALAGNGSVPSRPPPHNRLLARLTSLTAVTMAAAAAMIVLGVARPIGAATTPRGRPRPAGAA